MKKIFSAAICFFCALMLPCFGQAYYTLTLATYSNTGGILVSPPGQVVRGEGFLLFEPGSTVNLQAMYTHANSVRSYCQPAFRSHQWGGDWTGEGSAISGTIIMDSDKTISADFEIVPIPCPYPAVELRSTPCYITRRTGKKFSTGLEIIINDGGPYSEYALTFSYDPQLIGLDASLGTNGVEGALPVQPVTPGSLSLHSIPGETLRLNWVTLQEGTTEISVYGHVTQGGGLTRDGITTGITGILISELPGTGDADGSGNINILDALAVARYAIGIPSPLFNGVQADVDHDGNISIADSLMIAQYAVGLRELQGL